jgi:hypothetical protein
LKNFRADLDKRIAEKERLEAERRRIWKNCREI